MSHKEKLIKAMKNNPKGVKFNELKNILNECGFTHVRTSGSHEIYTHERIDAIVNIQNDKGKAKAYQVRQILEYIDLLKD